MKTPEEWFALLSNEGKVEVMKTQIKEQSETERLRLSEENTTHRTKVGSEPYNTTRAIFAVVILLITCCGTCVAFRGVEAWENVNRPPINPTASSKAE